MMNSGHQRKKLIADLVRESRQYDLTSSDPERNCWLAVHRHGHGVLPSEYDIRDVDEDLYLAVLAKRRAEDSLLADNANQED